MISFRADAAYGYGGKQFIARVTGRHPKFTFAYEFIGRKGGKRNEDCEADVDEPGLYVLRDSGVSVAFGDLPGLAAGDPIVGRLTLTVLSAIAEFEARRIGQRIKEAAAVRRARGDIMGTRDPRCQHMTDAHRRMGAAAAVIAHRKRAAQYRAGMRPIAQLLRDEGHSARGIAAILNERGYRTRRGLPWNGPTVSALLTVLPWE